MSTGPTAGQSAAGEPPGLREQLGATRDAAMGLVRAHLELARAELSEIADEVKRVALLGGIAAGLLLFLGVFLPVGLLLVVSLLNPTYMKPLFTHASGRVMLAVGVVMIVSGSLVIKKIVDIKV